MKRIVLPAAYLLLFCLATQANAQCTSCAAAQNDLDNLYYDLELIEDDISTLESQKSIAQLVVVSLLQVPPAQRDQQWHDDYDEAMDLLTSISADLYIAEAQRDQINEEISDLHAQMAACETCNP